MTLYELHIVCSITGLSTQIVGPYYNKTLIEEERDMYERNVLPSLATFSIVIRDLQKNPLTFIEELNKDTKTHNCFDAKFKPKTTTTIIPKDPNDPRDLPWEITFNSDKEENMWVTDIVNSAAVEIYKQNPSLIEPCSSLYGSLWHHGFVYNLIDYTHCSYKEIVNSWINKIGNKYDPVIISQLHGICSDGIYVGNFFSKDVKNLCEYCYRMFGIDKYDVAKLFELKDPTSIVLPYEISKRAYNEKMIGMIYAEKNDLESARKYYVQAVKTLDGQSWQCNFQRALDKFEKYVAEHGTSVLSSDL